MESKKHRPATDDDIEESLQQEIAMMRERFSGTVDFDDGCDVDEMLARNEV